MNLRAGLSTRFPIVAAHRGASRVAPENTLAAFDMAIKLGATALELDVQMTADEEIVVIHDWTLHRTTNGQGRVSEKSLAELRSLDAGSWFSGTFAGERIPLLDEVLSLAKGRAFVNVELKPNALTDVGLERRVVDIIRSHQMQADTLCMSFDHVSIQRLKQQFPEMIGLVICGARLADEADYLKSIRADGSNHAPLWWTPDTLRAFAEQGLICHGSLVNELALWERLAGLGIDMVDTDDVDIFSSPLRQKDERPTGV